MRYTRCACDTKGRYINNENTEAKYISFYFINKYYMNELHGETDY